MNTILPASAPLVSNLPSAKLETIPNLFNKNILKNKQNLIKVLFNSFHLNGRTLGFYIFIFLLICLKVCLRNRKHVPCFYRVIETRVEVWENEKCCGNTSHRRVFPQLFRVLPNFHECFYNSIETRRTCFLFLLETTATKKTKTTC